MAVTVKLPTPLRKYAEGQRQLAFTPGRVGDILGALVQGRPELEQVLFSDESRLKPTIRVYLGDTEIEGSGGLAAEASEGETIWIVPPVAGA